MPHGDQPHSPVTPKTAHFASYAQPRRRCLMCICIYCLRRGRVVDIVESASWLLALRKTAPSAHSISRCADWIMPTISSPPPPHFFLLLHVFIPPQSDQTSLDRLLFMCFLYLVVLRAYSSPLSRHVFCPSDLPIASIRSVQWSPPSRATIHPPHEQQMCSTRAGLKVAKRGRSSARCKFVVLM